MLIDKLRSTLFLVYPKQVGDGHRALLFVYEKGGGNGY